ncbi:hypothetical protein D3P96_07270 [Weissella viridescens]|uniref:Uncharacterized protein n=1 Tax=Weissella viridescens TaxID=1629 RepID=A0A3P2RJF7_WEIVI|nr:hypothetical protein [Weissella viridescens]RRG17568.1 hypothetical protein D3P96_07270 [Weissella viridescens]
MTIKTTQTQIEKAGLVMELIREQYGQYLNEVTLAADTFTSKADRQAITYLLNQNDQGLVIEIDKHNKVTWRPTSQ